MCSSFQSHGLIEQPSWLFSIVFLYRSQSDQSNLILPNSLFLEGRIELEMKLQVKSTVQTTKLWGSRNESVVTRHIESLQRIHFGCCNPSPGSGNWNIFNQTQFSCLNQTIFFVRISLHSNVFCCYFFYLYC